MEMESFYWASTLFEKKFNIIFKKIKLTFNLRSFCFSENYLTLTELKNCSKILSELTLKEVNVSH